MKLLKSLFVFVSMCLCFVTLTVSSIAVKATGTTKYKKVTSITELKAGDNVTFGCPDYNVYSGEDNSNHLKYLSNGVFSGTDNEILEVDFNYLTIGSVDATKGTISLKTPDGKYVARASKNYLKFTTYESMVELRGNEVYTNDTYKIQYNANKGTERFSNYTGTQKDAYLYKKVENEAPTPVNPIENLDMIVGLDVNYTIENNTININKINGKNDISLRFGFQFDAKLVEGNGNDVEYGVFYAKKSSFTEDTLEIAIRKHLSGPETEPFYSNVGFNKPVDENSTALNDLVKVDQDGNAYSGIGEYKYQCGVSLKGVPTNDITTEVVAVAYVLINGEYYFSQQRIESVASVCEKYLKIDEYTNYSELLNAVLNLSKGE